MSRTDSRSKDRPKPEKPEKSESSLAEWSELPTYSSDWTTDPYQVLRNLGLEHVNTAGQSHRRR